MPQDFIELTQVDGELINLRPELIDMMIGFIHPLQVDGERHIVATRVYLKRGPVLRVLDDADDIVRLYEDAMYPYFRRREKGVCNG